MSQVPVSVVNLTESAEESLCEAQLSAGVELEAGRDVVIVCESDHLNREARLMLAQPAMKKPRARLAIVHPAQTGVAQPLLAAISNCCQVFSNMDSAMQWLRPRPEALSGTLTYFRIQ